MVRTCSYGPRKSDGKCPRKSKTTKTKSKRKSGTRKSNPWMVHLAAYRKAHPEISYKQVMKEAKKTYTPVG